MRPASESIGSSVIQRDRQLAAVNVASSRLYLALQQRQQYLTQDKRAAIAAGRYDFTLSCLSLALRDIAKSEGSKPVVLSLTQLGHPMAFAKACELCPIWTALKR
jgi:hypothetical protein